MDSGIVPLLLNSVVIISKWAMINNVKNERDKEISPLKVLQLLVHCALKSQTRLTKTVTIVSKSRKAVCCLHERSPRNFVLYFFISLAIVEVKKVIANAIISLCDIKLSSRFCLLKQLQKVRECKIAYCTSLYSNRKVSCSCLSVVTVVVLHDQPSWWKQNWFHFHQALGSAKYFGDSFENLQRGQNSVGHETCQDVNKIRGNFGIFVVRWKFKTLTMSFDAHHLLQPNFIADTTMKLWAGWAIIS